MTLRAYELFPNQPQRQSLVIADDVVERPCRLAGEFLVKGFRPCAAACLWRKTFGKAVKQGRAVAAAYAVL